MRNFYKDRRWRGLSAVFLFAIVWLVGLSPIARAERSYGWPSVHEADSADQLERRIAPPDGYERVKADTGSFAHWLRGLYLKPGRPKVLLHDGRRKWRQDTHHAVVNIDVGRRDLQQCADACIRLYAEYLYSRGEFDRIRFNFTSGDTCRYTDWRAGRQPEAIREWAGTWWPVGADESYAGFRKYLDLVFTYAGTASFERECTKLTSSDSLRAGDLLLQPGFPGHVSMIADIAENTVSGERVYLLLESFTPAQEIVILRNANSRDLSPWYRLDCAREIRTPDWTFVCGDLRRPKALKIREQP